MNMSELIIRADLEDKQAVISASTNYTCLLEATAYSPWMTSRVVSLAARNHAAPHCMSAATPYKLTAQVVQQWINRQSQLRRNLAANTS